MPYQSILFIFIIFFTLTCHDVFNISHSVHDRQCSKCPGGGISPLDLSSSLAHYNSSTCVTPPPSIKMGMCIERMSYFDTYPPSTFLLILALTIELGPTNVLPVFYAAFTDKYICLLLELMTCRIHLLFPHPPPLSFCTHALGSYCTSDIFTTPPPPSGG